MTLSPQGMPRPTNPTPANDIVKLGVGVGPAGTFHFIPPDTGTVFLRVRGGGQVVNLTFGDPANLTDVDPTGGRIWTLNNATFLPTGSFFEFRFAVDGNEDFYIQGVLDGIREAVCFWRPY